MYNVTIVGISDADADEDSEVWQLSFADKADFDYFMASTREDTTLGLGGIFGIRKVKQLVVQPTRLED